MLRSLWTAATGMTAQQTNVDVIANNLANVNTVGYKTEVNEFKTLLYQTIQTKTTSANGEQKPIGAQVGLGVRKASITTIFKEGALFAVRGEDQHTYYPRNGNFVWTLAPNDGIMLSTTSGLPVMDSTGKPIILSKDYMTSRITVTADGEVCYPDENNNPKPLGIRIGVYQFSNPAGLERLDESRYQETAASGPALNEATNPNLKKTKVSQGFLEGSGVQVVDEMVNMIVAQRAYEMNSKAITAADEMMQQANNLRR